MKTKYYSIIIILIITSCLKEDELKRPFVSFTPVELNDEWELSSPQNEGIDSMMLVEIFRKFHADPKMWQARSLLVFRNNRLIAESYTKDDSDRITPRAVWSCTKQVVGLLTGIALEKGLINSVSDSIGLYLPETEIYPDKKHITIEQLLTMRSGIGYVNDGLSGQTDDILRQLPENILNFILARPQKYNPGETSFYKDCDPQLVSIIIQKSCGRKTSEWAREVLFEPMQITNIEWMEYKDGTTLGGFGIMTTPRELAKFGQLVLDSGMWKGNQLVDKKWITEMTTVRIEGNNSFQFGYLWWINTKRNLLYMHGHGGQIVIIYPEKKLVVVMTAEVNTQDDSQLGIEVFDWADEIVKIAN
jgi:CubicO group peptidase (beta-lactamase class C family)